MARKKRRPPVPPQQPPGDEPLHTPFGKLDALFHELSQAPEPPVTPPAPRPKLRPEPPASPPVQPKPKAPAAAEIPSDAEPGLFSAAMSDVTPLPKDRRGHVGKLPQTPHRDYRLADEVSALADLRDLVEGRGTFMLQYTDEYMEGVAPGVDQRLAQRLHQGDFAIQAHLDLHGYTVDEARVTVDRFLTNAYTSGQRCVRLVHGRGRNSIDNRPVLKEQVHLWLSHGRLSRLVLAFATAPLADGGAGAVYILLRREPHASRRK